MYVKYFWFVSVANFNKQHHSVYADAKDLKVTPYILCAVVTLVEQSFAYVFVYLFGLYNNIY